MTFELIVFVLALPIALMGGLFAWWLARGGSIKRQIFMASLIAALLSAPVVVGAGHGGGILPLPFAALPNTSVLPWSVALSVPITWLFWSFAFWLLNASVGATGRSRNAAQRPRRP